MLPRDLPSFASLRAFECAARLGSFKAAAEALNLSTSAVSHQIRALEKELGEPLFDRQPGGVELTDPARTYMKAVRAALGQLEKATETIRRTQPKSKLRVSLLSTLSTLWLIPELEQFHRQHPDTDIELIDDGELVDFGTARIDAAVRYDFTGRGEWRGLVTHPLLEEYVFPVCSPRYLQQHPGVVEPGWQRSHHLLVNSRHPDEWEQWFDGNGETFHLNQQGENTILDTSNMTLIAACSGMGVALGRTPFVDRMIETNELVRIGGAVQNRGVRHLLVYPAEHANRHQLVTFRDWIVSTARSCNANYLHYKE